MNPHTGCDFVDFGKTESVLNKGAEKIALLFNPPPVLSLRILPILILHPLLMDPIQTLFVQLPPRAV